MVDSTNRFGDGVVFQVLTIRCTRKLLKRLRAEARGDPRVPPIVSAIGMPILSLPNAGRWSFASANAPCSRRSSSTRDSGSFILAFQEAVQSVLREIGAASELVESEARETKQITIETTARRRVLGSLNDLASLARLTIADLYVRKAARLSGAGRSLMAAVARRALDLGCEAVYWELWRPNAAGRAFYQRLAAEEAGDLAVMCLDGERLSAMALLPGTSDRPR